MTPYCNNLKLGDPVRDVIRNRTGTVAAQPRESSTKVQVEFQGSAGAIYVPIAQLRLIVDGEPEDVPPHDGEIPASPAAPACGPRPADAPRAGPPDSAIDALTARRDYLKGQMDALTQQFTALRAEAEKIEAALAILAK